MNIYIKCHILAIQQINVVHCMISHKFSNPVSLDQMLVALGYFARHLVSSEANLITWPSRLPQGTIIIMLMIMIMPDNSLNVIYCI